MKKAIISTVCIICAAVVSFAIYGMATSDSISKNSKLSQFMSKVHLRTAEDEDTGSYADRLSNSDAKQLYPLLGVQYDTYDHLLVDRFKREEIKETDDAETKVLKEKKNQLITELSKITKEVVSMYDAGTLTAKDFYQRQERSDELYAEILACGLEPEDSPWEAFIWDVKCYKGVIAGSIEQIECDNKYPENTPYIYDLKPRRAVLKEFEEFIVQLEEGKFTLEGGRLRFAELKQKDEKVVKESRTESPKYKKHEPAPGGFSLKDIINAFSVNPE